MAIPGQLVLRAVETPRVSKGWSYEGSVNHRCWTDALLHALRLKESLPLGKHLRRINRLDLRASAPGAFTPL